MASLVSEKRFVEFEALKALVLKIGAVRKEYLDLFAKVNGVTAGHIEDYEALLARVDAIYKAGEGDKFTGVLQDAHDLIAELRSELGDTPTEAAEIALGTAYDRLRALEATAADHENRIVSLEDNTFGKVKVNSKAEIAESNNIHIDFFAKDAAEDAPALGSIDIDTTDFVVDGMLSDVKIVTIVNKGDAATDGAYVPTVADRILDLPAVPEAYRKDGDRYFIFSFKTVETDTADAAGTQQNLTQEIWVNVEDLHDNFIFKAEAPKADYVSLVVAEPVHDSKGATTITYTVDLGAKAVNDFAIVEGAYNRAAEGEAVALNRGLLKTEDDLAVAEGKITDLEVRADELYKKAEDGTATGLVKDNADAIATLQDQVVNGYTENVAGEAVEVPGLLDRAADLEAWTRDNVISVQEINDFFDYYVFMDVKNADDPNDPALKAVDARTAAYEGRKQDWTTAPTFS